MSNSHKLLYSVGAGLSITAVSGLYYWYYKYLKGDVMPTRWRRVGTLEQLHLFPIKSCAPLELPIDQEIDCELLGLRFDEFRDRGLMIIDNNDKMITARVYPKMVLISTKKVGAAVLVLNAPSMQDSLELDFSLLRGESSGKGVHTAVWDAKLKATLCGDKYDKWLSQCILGKETGLRLVYYPHPKPVRKLFGPLAKVPHITNDDTGAFNDSTSYLLINLASVNDLNARLDKPINAQQFRGNFQLKMDNDEPYAEDNWNWVRIGDEAVFRVLAPRTRCIFININKDTGNRDPDCNPYKALAGYRKFPEYRSPIFGAHMGIRQTGKIKINDVVYIGEL